MVIAAKKVNTGHPMNALITDQTESATQKLLSVRTAGIQTTADAASRKTAVLNARALTRRAAVLKMKCLAEENAKPLTPKGKAILVNAQKNALMVFYAVSDFAALHRLYGTGRNALKSATGFAIPRRNVQQVVLNAKFKIALTMASVTFL